jgi:hypothetical protein
MPAAPRVAPPMGDDGGASFAGASAFCTFFCSAAGCLLSARATTSTPRARNPSSADRLAPGSPSIDASAGTDSGVGASASARTRMLR